MDWYRDWDGLAQSMAIALANQPQVESEINNQLARFPQNLRKILWDKINYYIRVYLEQGGGEVLVSSQKYFHKI